MIFLSTVENGLRLWVGIHTLLPAVKGSNAGSTVSLAVGKPILAGLIAGFLLIRAVVFQTLLVDFEFLNSSFNTDFFDIFSSENLEGLSS